MKIIFLESENRVSDALFCNLIKQVDKLTEIISFLFMKVLLQCFMLPKLIISCVFYLTSDFGSDSFVLPVPMW